MGKKMIPVFEFRDGWCFRTDVYDELGKRRQVRRTFNTEAEAQAAYFAFMAQKTQGQTAGLLAPESMTLGEWLDKWIAILEDAGNPETTIDGYKQICRDYLNPHISHIKLGALNEDHIRACYRALRDQGLSTNTILSAHRRLRRALNVALQERKITRNPALNVRPPKGTSPKPIVILTKEHLAALRTVMVDSRLAPLWVLELHTGMRRGELVGLHWSQIDLETGVLTISTQRTVTSLGRIVERDTTKTEAGKRDLPLPSGVVDTLRAWKARQAQERLRLGERWHGSDYVFTTQDGTPYHPQTPTKILRKLAEKAKIPALPLHHLRHTFGTNARKAGIELEVLSKLMGHHRTEVTANMYVHPTSTMQGEALEDYARHMFG